MATSAPSGASAVEQPHVSDIYNVLLGLKADMGEVRGTVSYVKEKLDDSDTRLDRAEMRIGGVETKLNRFSGAVAALGTAIAVAVGIVKYRATGDA